MSTLKTLDRGLQALHIVARKPGGISIADLAADLGVDRAIAYRIVSTLGQHGLISRQPSGKLVLGAGILELERRFEPQFRQRARPLLDQLAQDTQATAFISAAQQDRCAAILVSEPEDVLIRVGYRVGSTHPIEKGAAGIAILAGRAAQPEDTPDVSLARAQGFALTRGILQAGAVGVASPITDSHGHWFLDASVGVVAMEDLDTKSASTLVRNCAHALSDLLRN